MSSPFTEALELAWQDGGLSISGARLLEEVQVRLRLSDEARSLLEEKWLNKELVGRQRKGFGTGDAKLAEWIQELPSQDEFANSARAIGCAAVKKGLSKIMWSEAYKWAESHQLGYEFASGVWDIQECSMPAKWHTVLTPLADIIGL